MAAPIDTVRWCALERPHQPRTVSTPVLRPNWKAGCLATYLSGLDRGKGRKTLPIGIPNLGSVPGNGEVVELERMSKKRLIHGAKSGEGKHGRVNASERS